MYEFHGWCAVRESPEEVDDGGLSGIVDEVRQLVDGLGWGSGECDLRPVNGAWFLHFWGHSNRPRQEAEDVDRLLELVARVAPGSYGLVYDLDDESTTQDQNAFRVRVLTRGTLEERPDTFLSPVQPTIED